MRRSSLVVVDETTCTVGAGPGWGAGSWASPSAPTDAVPEAAAAGAGPPPGAESSANWSMSSPVAEPGALSTTWLPADNVIPAASAPQGVTLSPSPARAPWVEPVTFTATGVPSTVRRLERHVAGSEAGGG